MTDHTTHDLAIARAERDAWQSTCEELHRTIAGRDVEIEAHLGRCEAADQRARSLDAALTAEREASRGLVALLRAERDEAEGVRNMAVAESEGLAAQLEQIRDLVAPGNPQGTVVDAVRAMATGLIESIGARDAAEQARDMARDSRDAAIARAEAAERTLSGLYDDSKAELAKLRAELAELTITRDRLLAREHEDGRLHAQLRAELAELRARPALTVEAFTEAYIKTKHGGKAWPGEEADRRGLTAQFRATFAALGPVTLPSPDRAEELAATLVGTARASMTDVPIAWSCDFADGNENARRALTNVVRTALAKLSPDPAPAFDTAFLRRVMVATKHGPNGKGGPGPCDAACVKCEAELMAKAAPARKAAPTLVAVSDEELAVAFYSEPERPALRECIDAADLAGIRAVRAKLGAAEVTEERLREAIREERHVSSFVAEDTAKGVLARLRATAAKGG